MTSSVDPDKIWIYHERQEALLCGQHALNNLAQSSVFAASELSEIAHQLDQMELRVWAQNSEGGVHSKDYIERLREGSNNVDAQGNFSIEVLKAAVQQRFGISLPHLSEQDLLSGKDITDCQGFLCHKSDHWFAIRKIGGRFWNLNSTLELPFEVSHFQLATEMEKWKKQGYTIFCVPSGFPEAGTKVGVGSSWHKMAGLLRGTSQKDAWENVGSGMRLDGRTTAPTMVVEGLSEDEQLQIALMASMEQSKPMPRVVSEGVTVPPEPAEGTPGAARIQFRLPDGRRMVRRFLQTDLVSVVYAFVEQESPDRAVELLCGFPPKNLAAASQQTILDAKLAGESIQARYKL
jgi:ataxin-3